MERTNERSDMDGTERVMEYSRQVQSGSSRECVWSALCPIGWTSSRTYRKGPHAQQRTNTERTRGFALATPHPPQQNNGQL